MVFAGAAAPRPSAASADADSDRGEVRPEVKVFKRALDEWGIVGRWDSFGVQAAVTR